MGVTYCRACYDIDISIAVNYYHQINFSIHEHLDIN